VSLTPSHLLKKQPHHSAESSSSQILELAGNEITKKEAMALEECLGLKIILTNIFLSNIKLHG